MAAQNLIIGITGAMGAGKTEATRILAELSGYPVCDTDRLAHQLYRPGSPIWQELVACFGREILNADQEIERSRLGAMVFADAAKLQALSCIVHPPLLQEIARQIATARRRGEGLIVDAALLYELGLAGECDQVWVVDAPMDTLCQRAQQRSGLSREQIARRLQAQTAATVKRTLGDRVIANEGSRADLARQIKHAWEALRAAPGPDEVES